MTSFHDVLRIERDACPEDCSLCLQTCAERKDGGGLAVIQSVQKPGAKLHSVVTCHQCRQPKCMEVCPSQAIVKDKADGIVRIDEGECVGCRLCVEACPYGAIYFDEKKTKPSKCEVCGGRPRCVEACPHGVMTFLKSKEIRKHLGPDQMAAVYMCQGCAAELAVRLTQKVVGKGAIYFVTSSCMGLAFMTTGVDKCYQSSSMYYCRMSNIASSMTGVRRYFHKKGQDVPLIAFAGDGSTVDIGFNCLSGAAERGENFVYICYDNQGYMNTGIQRSGSTPFGAWTATTPVGPTSSGKTRPAKNVPLILAFNGAAYVATATVAFLEDYVQKLTKALSVKQGMAYIHLLAPCPTGWRAPIDSSIELSRLAVETNLFPLWEAEKRQFRLTYQPKKVKPVSQFTKLQGRFSHLHAGEIDMLQQLVNEEFTLIKGLTDKLKGDL